MALPPAGTNKSDQETDFWFYPEEDSTSPIGYVYFSGTNAKYDEVPTQTSSMITAYNETCELSEVQNGTFAGMDAYYYYYNASNTDQETGVVNYSQSFNCYFRGPRNTTIVMLLSVSGDSEDVYLSEEVLLEQAEISPPASIWTKKNNPYPKKWAAAARDGPHFL